MNIHHAHLRIARPTRNLIQIRRFYTEGLGMSVVYEGGAQIEERRWELVMCGFENAEWHLEFTYCEPDPIVPTPTVEDLRVFYLGDQQTVESTKPSADPLWSG